MKGSLPLGQYKGIKVFIHWTFLILPIWIITSGLMNGLAYEAILWQLLFIFAIFFCIVLHEFGHALTARHFKFKTKDITLLPIGGVARMDQLPQVPRQELLVALAGPVVNFVISGLLYILLTSTNNIPTEEKFEAITSENFLFMLMSVNFMLALFNLIPALPMDGGRVLRALLAHKISRVKATQIAAYTGQFIAVLFILSGLMYNLFLAVIGVFVLLGSKAEWYMERTKSALGDFKVQDVLMHKYNPLDAKLTLKDAIALLLDSSEQYFLVIDNDKVVGTLHRNDIISAISIVSQNSPLSEIMNKEFSTLSLKTPLDQIFLRPDLRKQGIIPVMKNGALVGILDIENIYEFIAIHDAFLQKELFSIKEDQS